MDVNPYKSPETVDREKPVVPYLDMGSFEVVGNTIHCGPKLFLPMHCVLTGEEEDLEVVERKLRYLPIWGRILWILFLPMFTIFPAVSLNQMGMTFIEPARSTPPRLAASLKA